MAVDTRRVGILVIESVVAEQRDLLGGVYHLYVSESLAEAGQLVVIEGVAGEGVAVFRHHERAAVEVGLMGVGVVDTVGGMDCAIFRDYGRDRVEDGDVGVGVVEHLLREDVEGVVVAEAVKLHPVAEERVFGCRGVFPIP